MERYELTLKQIHEINRVKSRRGITGAHVARELSLNEGNAYSALNGGYKLNAEKLRKLYAVLGEEPQLSFLLDFGAINQSLNAHSVKEILERGREITFHGYISKLREAYRKQSLDGRRKLFGKIERIVKQMEKGKLK